MAIEKKEITKDNNEEDKEITRLRDAVLKWVEAKETGSKQQSAKTERSESGKSKLKMEDKKEKDRPKITESLLSLPEKFSPFSISASPKVRKRKKKTARINKIKIYQTIPLLLLFCLLALTLFGAGLYRFKWQNPTAQFITKIIPYPAVIVNLKPIPYWQWQKQVQTLINFYEKQKIDNPDLTIPNLAEAQYHIMERMIQQALLNQLAKNYNIEISNEAIEEQTQKLIEEIGGKEILADQLRDLYGWTIEDFQKEILKPLLLKTKLSIAVTVDDRINQSARNRAEEILTKIKSGQDSFENLARQYSEDITASQGGDLGYFTKGQMVPEFEKAAFTLKVEEISDIVKTQFGYHIIKVAEILTDENNEVIQVKAKHILIRGKDLDAYLEELREKANIWQLVKI